jgi:hypothetical protein
MAIIGQLAEFSLPELFQFLEQGEKSGRLTISIPPDAIAQADANPSAKSDQPTLFYIWFRRGRIIAAADRLDGKGLLMLMHRRGWLEGIGKPELQEFAAMLVPLGVYLRVRAKAKEPIKPDQLKLVFYSQVMRQVCRLFAFPTGSFEFDSTIPLPMSEMTGQMMPPTEVTLAALRVLKNWDALLEKLPEPTSTLVSPNDGQKPHLKLNQVEWQVWEFTGGNMSLKNIAEQVRLSIEEVQRIAFRLIVVGMVEEVPMMAGMAMEPADANLSGTEGDANEVSIDFLQNLLTFLKGKT